MRYKTGIMLRYLAVSLLCGLCFLCACSDDGVVSTGNGDPDIQPTVLPDIPEPASPTSIVMLCAGCIVKVEFGSGRTGCGRDTDRIA